MNGDQKGHKHFRELRRTPYILHALFIDVFCIFLNERSDKIVFYILFKTQRPSDTMFEFRVKSNSSQRLYVQTVFFLNQI